VSAREAEIAALAEGLVGASRLLVITGAGMSADAGIPTYRGVGGLYDGHPGEDGLAIEDILSAEVFAARPALTWRALFEIDRIRSEPVDAAAVADYYAACHDAYRKYHSPEGAVHMALNEDGRFDAAGFTGQLRRLEAAWGEQAPRDVLEIGFGMGAATAELAIAPQEAPFS
jgi:NAD-dependent deacetylase